MKLVPPFYSFNVCICVEEGTKCTQILKEGDLIPPPFPLLNQCHSENQQPICLLKVNLCCFLAGSSQPSGTAYKEVASRICRRVCWLVMSPHPPNFPWPEAICEYKEIVQHPKDLRQESLWSKFMLERLITSLLTSRHHHQKFFSFSHSWGTHVALSLADRYMCTNFISMILS